MSTRTLIDTSWVRAVMLVLHRHAACGEEGAEEPLSRAVSELEIVDQFSRFSFRQPPALLSAMICLNIAVSADALMVSP